MTCVTDQCSADCHAWQPSIKLHAVAAAWGSVTLQGLSMRCRLSTDMVMIQTRCEVPALVDLCICHTSTRAARHHGTATILFGSSCHNDDMVL